MSLTRANVESMLVHTYGEWLRRVGLDADTCNGTNADLNVVLEAALDARNVPIADRAAVTDDDLAGLPEGAAQRTYADARLACLEVILGHWARVDYTEGSNSQSLDQFRKGVEAERDALKKVVDLRWPLPTGVGGVAIGCMTSGVDWGAGGLYGPCCPGSVEPPFPYRWPGGLP